MDRRALSILSALLVLPALVAADPGTLTFATTSVASLGSGEPGLHLDPATDAIYATDPHDLSTGSAGGTSIRVSNDDGASWSKLLSTTQGGADADVALDADGVLYATDLNDASGNPTVVVTTVEPSQGPRSVALSPGASVLRFDREWIAASGHGHVVVVARDGTVERAWVSDDKAITFAGPFDVATNVEKAGRIVDAGAQLVVPYTTSSEVWIARSADGGRTWTPERAGSKLFAGSYHFPSYARDAGGNEYVVWTTGSGPIQQMNAGALDFVTWVMMVSKTPTGHWSSPVHVSEDSTNPLFGTLVAGDAGKIDVVYYRQSGQLWPDISTPVTTWDVVVSQAMDGASGAPHFTHSVVYPAFHMGSICTGGLALCPGPQQVGVGNAPTPFDRRDLDFFGAVADPNGNLVVVFPRDRPATNALGIGGNALDVARSWVEVVAARQTSGPKLR